MSETLTAHGIKKQRQPSGQQNEPVVGVPSFGTSKSQSVPIKSTLTWPAKQHKKHVWSFPLHTVIDVWDQYFIIQLVLGLFCLPPLTPTAVAPVQHIIHLLTWRSCLLYKYGVFWLLKTQQQRQHGECWSLNVISLWTGHVLLWAPEAALALWTAFGAQTHPKGWLNSTDLLLQL